MKGVSPDNNSGCAHLNRAHTMIRLTTALMAHVHSSEPWRGLLFPLITYYFRHRLTSISWGSEGSCRRASTDLSRAGKTKALPIPQPMTVSAGTGKNSHHAESKRSLEAALTTTLGF